MHKQPRGHCRQAAREARTEVRAVDDLHEPLLRLALAQRQPDGGRVRDDVTADRLFGVRHEHGAAGRVAHDLRWSMRAIAGLIQRSHGCDIMSV